MFGIYVHIPFCVRKCAYCDFVSYAGEREAMPRYVDAVVKEARTAAPLCAGKRVTSVYIGGGTPTLLPTKLMANILAALRSNFDIDPAAEISCECNPGTVDATALAGLRGNGVSRLSIGVQAAQDALLRRIGRIHTVCEAERAFRAAREAGFCNINLDLMYGLPGQTAQMWRDTLDWAIGLAPEHLSLYSLILEEGTPLYQRVESGAETLPDEDAVLDMLRLSDDITASNGYSKYEISNYSRPGCECRHNVLYWLNGEYLGLGCAAHSRLGMKRLYNHSSLGEYIDAVERRGTATAGETELSPEDDAFDTLMLGTRMLEGVERAEYAARHGEAALARLEPKLRELQKRGLIADDPRRIRLTREGLLLQNSLLVELMP